MRCSRVLAVLAGIAFASAPAGAEDKREPKLASVTDAQMKEGISARAGRNYAWIGYNTPEIHLQCRSFSSLLRGRTSSRVTRLTGRKSLSARRDPAAANSGLPTRMA